MHCNDEVELQRLEVVPGYWSCPKKSDLGHVYGYGGNVEGGLGIRQENG